MPRSGTSRHSARRRGWIGEGLGCVVLVLLLALPGEVRGETVYKFGLLPLQRSHSGDDPRRGYQPLLDYLGGRVGVRIVPVTGRTYDDVIEYLVEGRIHLCALAAVSYVVAQRRNPDLRVLVGEMTWSPDHTVRRDTYDSLIIVRNDETDISTLEDLRGHSFAFVDPQSSSGYRFPLGVLAAKRIDFRKFFSRYYFLGSHSRVTDALAAGSVDAGVTWDHNLAVAQRKYGDIFRVLHRERVPAMLIATHPSLPPNDRERLRQALLGVDMSKFPDLPVAGYVERTDGFYDSVRALLDREERDAPGGAP